MLRDLGEITGMRCSLTLENPSLTGTRLWSPRSLRRRWLSVLKSFQSGKLLFHFNIYIFPSLSFCFLVEDSHCKLWQSGVLSISQTPLQSIREGWPSPKSLSQVSPRDRWWDSRYVLRQHATQLMSVWTCSRKKEGAVQNFSKCNWA